jgi:hypothetical protein
MPGRRRLPAPAPARPMTTRAPPAIELAGLRKPFGGTDALAGGDLAVPEGAVDGGGPNGARMDRRHSHVGHPHRSGRRLRPRPRVRHVLGGVAYALWSAGRPTSVDEELTGREILLPRADGRGRQSAGQWPLVVHPESRPPGQPRGRDQGEVAFSASLKCWRAKRHEDATCSRIRNSARSASCSRRASRMARCSAIAVPARSDG